MSEATPQQGEGTVPMTPEALRYIAKTLDLTQTLVAAALRQGLVRVNDKPMEVEKAESLAQWCEGTEQQDSLRAWADELEAAAQAGEAA